MQHNSVRIKFMCAKKDIIYFNGVVDSYEGLGLIRTVDSEGVNCVLFTSEGLSKTMLKLIDELILEGVDIKNIKVDSSEIVDF